MLSLGCESLPRVEPSYLYLLISGEVESACRDDHHEGSLIETRGWLTCSLQGKESPGECPGLLGPGLHVKT